MVEEKYAIEQLEEAALSYFDNDSLASNVWTNKYALKLNGKFTELSPTDTIKRITDEIYRMECKFPNSLSYEEIHNNLKDFQNFIFGGSILFGLGNPYQISSLGNCFFIDNKSDSYGGIMNIDETMAQLMKRRGGVGITIENLRPNTAIVNNSAQSSTGAVSFMSRYDKTTQEVAQDGRRGALMISMHVNHPDILDFIKAKDNTKKINNANISVKVTDEFIKAANEDQDYILSWPVSDKQLKVTEQYTYNKLYYKDGTYIRRVRAKEIWDAIIKQAHKNAEPGVLFWDNITNESPADCYQDLGFKTIGTNPCIIGSTLIATADGRNAVTIKQLAEEGRDIPVYCLNDKGKVEIQTMRNPKITGYKKPIYEVKLDDGNSVKCTENHKIRLKDGTYKEAKDLEYGDSLYTFNKHILSLNEIFHKSNSRSSDYMWISGLGKGVHLEHRIIKRYKKAVENGYNAKIVDNHVFVERECEECSEKYWKNYDIREISFCSTSCSNNYLNRTTDINKRRTNSINKTYKKKGEIKTENQLKIYNDLKFYLKRDPLPNEWGLECKKNNISSRLGTKYSLKNWEELVEFSKDYNHKVVSVEFIGYENVYNGTADKWHNFFIGGFKSKNKANKDKFVFVNNLQCGEVPLSPDDSCRLASLILSNFVLNSYKKRAKIDWDKLEKTARFAQRVMDDIVSLEEEKILGIIKKIKADPEDIEIKRTELKTWEKILKVLRNGRRTGIGVLGLEDMLAKLNIQYGSKTATKLIDKIFRTIAVTCYKESVQLAKERGAFPIWNYEKEANNPFLSRVIANNFSNDEYNEYVKYGRRNIACLSIAPTGTLAILARTTSGIEPVFKIYYKRRRKVNANDENPTVAYVDEHGNEWEEYNVFHHEFIKWFSECDERMQYGGAKGILEELSDEKLKELISKSPWAGSESHDVDYLEKIRMQGVIQKWIDHSISVTHNLPENITLEEVDNIYYEAWKVGCKGCTIYREGSRIGVLLSKNNNNGAEFKEHHAPKRPKVLEADYYLATSQGEKFAVVVGLYPKTNKPFEIFAFRNPPINVHCKGKIIKVKKNHYKFESEKGEIDNLQLAAEFKEARSYTMLLSMLLRHGAPLGHIIHVAAKVDDSLAGFSSVCRRMLSKYLDPEIQEEKCPECGGSLVQEEGCTHCTECGFSKCG